MSRATKFLDLFWGSITIIVTAIMLFSIGRNLLHAMDIRSQVATLEYESNYYLEHIAADSTLLEQLKYDDILEKFARERYRMKAPGEELFIIED
ncbi:MAG: septum formation initiator family protein [Rikenellaceae bacterium]